MSMDPDRWRRIRSLLESAIELAIEERADFLDQACAGDRELRREIDELLDHDARTAELAVPFAQGWIRDAAESFASAAGASDESGGRRVGAYRLVREIGAGGMGKVYLAERDDAHFQKRVAVKLIKRGMDTDEILRRFKNERQILADLEHPNIARLLDGGATEEGHPYLVLEFVDGIPIDRWCDEHRATVRQRIELFLSVCSAVALAHRSLVVHRDIKPSNILVTAEGVPKLLDFGIAKLLGPPGEEHTALYTSTSERRLTPAYASPEQLRGEAITTASDVFSLGVVLYELLTGEKPFESRDRTAESAAFEHPEKPSTIVAAARRRSGAGAARSLDVSALSRMLSGDLDTIVLKAMHGEPARRYASVDQLAADLRRHLDGLPVHAQPDSLGYRASKFVKRNKLLVAATSTILVALAVGFTTSTALYFEAVDAQHALTEKTQLAENRLQEAKLAQAAEKVQRELAERRFADVRKLATTFIFDVHDAIEPLQGSLPAQQLIVKTATEYLQRLASEKRDDADLQLELAQAWVRIGTIQSAHGTANLGQTGAALHSMQRAFDLAQDLVHADPTNANKCMVLVDAHIRLTESLISMHRLRDARSACEETVDYVGRLHAEHPETLAFEHQLFRAQYRFADVLQRLGDYEGSLEHYRASVAIAEKLAGEWAGYDDMQARLGVSLGQLGQSLEKNGDFEESLRMERRALEIFQRLVDRSPQLSTWRREVGVCQSLLARTYSSQGCIADACAESRRGVETMIALSQGDEMNASSLTDTASMLTQFGRYQNAAGNHEDALRHCRAALGYFDDLVYRNPDNLNVRQLLATAYTCLASTLTSVGRRADGLRAYQDACNELEALAAVDPSDASVEIDLNFCYANLGESRALLAAESASGPAERIAELRVARSLLAHGIDGIRRLMPRGFATGSGSARLEELEEDVRRCDAALARMGADAQDGSVLEHDDR